MDFGPNISPIEVIEKGFFGGTYFRNIYSGVNDKIYRDSWKEFGKVKNGLIKLIHMVGLNGILGIGKEEDLKMIKGKLIDGKELSVDLKVF